MFYKEAYEQLRADPQLALPPEYSGKFPPRAKFQPGSPAPLIMWPHSKDNEQETCWPQNGTPRTAVFTPGLLMGSGWNGATSTFTGPADGHSVKGIWISLNS